MAEMDVADNIRIVQRPRNGDNIICFAGNRLIRRYQSRDIFHADVHRIDLQLHSPLPGKSDGSLRQPVDPVAILHREALYSNAVEAAADCAVKRLKRLLEQLPLHSGKRRPHLWISGVARDRSADLGVTVHVRPFVKALRQRQIKMAGRKGKVQFSSLRNCPFKPDLSAAFQASAEIIEAQRRTVSGKRRLRLGDRYAVDGSVPCGNTAIKLKRRHVCSLAGKSQIRRKAAAKSLRRVPQGSDINIHQRDRAVIALSRQIKFPCAPDRSAKSLRRQRMHREMAFPPNGLRRRIFQRIPIQRPLRCPKLAIRHRRRRRPRNRGAKSHRSLKRTFLKEQRRIKSIRFRDEIKRRLPGTKHDGAANRRLLPRARRAKANRHLAVRKINAARDLVHVRFPHPRRPLGENHLPVIAIAPRRAPQGERTALHFPAPYRNSFRQRPFRNPSQIARDVDIRSRDIKVQLLA